MIRIFYGDDRIKAGEMIKKTLGQNYEIIEGTELTPSDLPNIFQGNSLFNTKRNILIRDITLNKAVAEKLPDYLDTPHNIVIQESKIAKNSAFYKSLQKKAEFREFKIPEMSTYAEAQNIYRIAKKDGKKALAELEKIKHSSDPIALTGIIISFALKEFETRQGSKEKRVLLELSKLDRRMKSTSLSPWTLLQAFLLQLSSWQ